MSNKIVIDLKGPQGNAFTLISMANEIGKKFGWHPNKRGEINTEMISGNYEDLLRVFEREFGFIVKLKR